MQQQAREAVGVCVCVCVCVSMCKGCALIIDKVCDHESDEYHNLH